MLLNQTLDDWKAINWQEVYRKVNRLRQRIYRASTAGDLKRVRNLQRLLIRSTANMLLAIRQVSQCNKGKRTAGLDGYLALGNQDRLELFKRLNSYEPQHVRPVKRVFIPKANGKKRPLGIGTIVDRCQQTVIKAALEPYWEAQFEATSYGFRQGRSPHDAIERARRAVRMGSSRQWILDADIEGAFDNISHEHLSKQIGNFPARKWIECWLKAGIMEGERWVATPRGTPQGGPISPLLLNIALHGMEDHLGVQFDKPGVVSKTSPYVVVRYADDTLVMAKSQEDAQRAAELLQAWLGSRGLRLSSEKTRIRHLEEGVDFLGVNIKIYKSARKRRGKVVHAKPSQGSVEEFVKELRLMWKTVTGMPVEQAIIRLNQKVLGWGNYHRHYVSKRLFSKLDSWMWVRQVRYSLRRHPKKSWHWRKARYWGKVPWRKDMWVFMDLETGKYLQKLSWIPTYRHRLVKGRNSPDDPELRAYWAERQQMRIPYGSKVREKLWKRQKGKCMLCQAALENGEELHVHHIKPKREGGGNELSNLSLLHEACHRQVHSRYGKELKPLAVA